MGYIIALWAHLDIRFSQVKKPFFTTFIQLQVIWQTIRIVTNTTDVLRRLRWSTMNHHLTHFTSLIWSYKKKKSCTFSIRKYEHDCIRQPDVPVASFEIPLKFTIQSTIFSKYSFHTEPMTIFTGSGCTSNCIWASQISFNTLLYL